MAQLSDYEQKEELKRRKEQETRRRRSLNIQYPKMIYREDDKTCTIVASPADEKLVPSYQQEPWPEVTEVAPKYILFSQALEKEKQRLKKEAKAAAAVRKPAPEVEAPARFTDTV